MKKNRRHLILFTILATGISSVTSQLVMVREFLALFSGNEFLIAMVLFSWLTAGGLGSLAFLIARRRPLDPESSPAKLGRLSLFLCTLSVAQVFFIRYARDFLFVFGSSPGFYATFSFSFFTLLPYAFLVGFALPFSLRTARTHDPNFPGGLIYLTDNAGDALGGALFSFVLVQLLPPVLALSVAAIPLFAAGVLLIRKPMKQKNALWVFFAFLLMVAGPFFETASLAPASGQLIRYEETRYGRLTALDDKGQITVFQDGEPAVSSYDPETAEKSVHYALAQVDLPKSVLVISAKSGAIDEVYKYHPDRVDYVEIDPQLTAMLRDLALIRPRPGLSLIHEDARAWLARSRTWYDAILVHLPEPGTFQVNRFYTREWFELAASHLRPGGVLSFSVKGFDSYLDPHRQRIVSCLVKSSAKAFDHILPLPGHQITLLCSDNPLAHNIPALLEKKHIGTQYIRNYYNGDVSSSRIEHLASAILPDAPINTDTHPRLMVLMFASWFYQFKTSPWVFAIILATGLFLYLPRLSRQDFLLFSTGWATMGSEILVIFSIQIFFGFIYYQIGIIVTVFLAGLLPGAYLGTRKRISQKTPSLLAGSDLLFIVLLLIFAICLTIPAIRTHLPFYLLFGALISFACGFQFPLVLATGKDRQSAAGRAFGADLMGAAFGVLITSMVLIPYLGLVYSAMCLVMLKTLSLIIIFRR